MFPILRFLNSCTLLRVFLVLGVSLGLFCILSSCIKNQITGSRALVLVPDEVMNDLGVQSYREVLAQSKVSSEPRWNQLTKRVAQRIAQASGASYRWEFNLIQSNEANAFALPGGKIAVYTGILAPAQTEAALAFIVGHEVGHVIARHGAQRVSQSLLAQGALIALSETFRYSENRELILAGVGLGSQVGVLLPFSRFHESEADNMGIVFMARAGYDPQEAPKFWQRMGAGGVKPPEFLSTHPSDERRTQDLQGLMREALAIYAQAPIKYGKGERLP